ncbi:phage tail tip lysozyme [Lactobacillus helsingborgensis]|uniref:phage tail tip lysozyme n=1 Tax=Lactobacillus helsingborgensis TaxID=1218494 RepID=UPI00226504E4|nr:phage tail tip lysozyme [Lactobacillus helsingborgensis]UZX32393.1 phage tail-type lysozyme domain-containing protein [Lactobacillus helsingborgensis]
MVLKIIRKKLLTPSFIISIFTILLFIIIIAVVAGGSLSDQISSCSSDATDFSISAKGKNGSWSQKGTKEYNIGKSLFNFLVKKEGFSGAGAAGAVAVGVRESSLNPAAINDKGGVAGIFQWSGFTNNVNGHRITNGGFIHAGKVSDLTLKNEIKLTSYELHHDFSSVRRVVGNAKSPQEAAKQWSVCYEGVALSDSQTNEAQIQSDAKKAYRIFGGSGFKSNKSLLASAATSASNSVSDKAGDDECDADLAESGPLLAEAQKLIGYFTYGGHTKSSYGGWKNPNKNGLTDCSGFVWLCMKRAGYAVGNDAFDTATMEKDARGSHKFLKQISAKSVRPGDIIIVNVGSGNGSNGHTAIIKGNYKGYRTKIIEMGGDDHSHVHISNIHDSFLSLLQKNARVIWARPIKRK